MAEQESGLWDKAVQGISAALIWGQQISSALSLLVMALISRIRFPIALKSERDQIKLRDHKPSSTN